MNHPSSNLILSLNDSLCKLAIRNIQVKKWGPGRKSLHNMSRTQNTQWKASASLSLTNIKIHRPLSSHVNWPLNLTLNFEEFTTWPTFWRGAASYKKLKKALTFGKAPKRTANSISLIETTGAHSVIFQTVLKTFFSLSKKESLATICTKSWLQANRISLIPPRSGGGFTNAVKCFCYLDWSRNLGKASIMENWLIKIFNF